MITGGGGSWYNFNLVEGKKYNQKIHQSKRMKGEKKRSIAQAGETDMTGLNSNIPMNTLNIKEPKALVKRQENFVKFG